MVECVSVAQMRQSDAYTIAHLVSGLELIGRAAYSVYRAVSWSGRAAIVIGSGNNGADGIALGCILRERGIACDIYRVSDHLHGDAAYYAEKAEENGIHILPYAKGCLSGYDIIVDCMLGTGFRGGVRESYCTAIGEINDSAAYLVSVDINSGMDGDTGEGECIVHSDLTVTVGFVKQGQLTAAAGRVMKRLVCVDIGIVSVGETRPLADNKNCPWLDTTLYDYRPFFDMVH